MEARSTRINCDGVSFDVKGEAATGVLYFYSGKWTLMIIRDKSQDAYIC